MKCIEVTDKKLARKWIEFPKQHYKNDRNWVCPLDAEIESIFNPEANQCFQHGEAIRWIMIDEQDQIKGRIAAFIDHNKVDHYDYPTGGAGFFECINDREAANLLFDTAKAWLEERGIRAMQAPINFGENYSHWGLLVEGFEQQGYGMPYNYPYYQDLFENYGFKNYFDQLSFHKDLADGWPEYLVKFSAYAESRPGYSFDHLHYDNLDKYIDDFVSVYNGVWSKYHEGYTPLQHEEIRTLVKEAKLLLEEDFIWFAYDNGSPVALMVVFPDINQVLKKLKNGKLTLINKLKLVYYRKRAVSRSRVLIFGLLPEYKNSGIVAALFYQFVKVLGNKPRHEQIELSWVGDYNPKMISIYEKIGSKPAKKHVTYLKLFDPDAKFRRFDNEFEGKLY